MRGWWVLLCTCFLLVLGGCAGNQTQPTPDVKVSLGAVPSALRDSTTAIRRATPESLKQAYHLLKDSEAGKSENGAELLFLSYKMLRILYPLMASDIPEVLTPQRSIFPDIFKRIEAGIYPTVPQEKTSFLTLFIPPLTVLYTSSPEVVALARESLGQVESLAPDSVLPPLLFGFLFAREGSYSRSLEQYERVLAVSEDCYPAVMGASLCLVKLNQPERALRLLAQLDGKIPMQIDRLILTARSHYLMGNYEDASEIVAEALQVEPENDDALILKAEILFAQGYIDQANRFLSIVEKREKGGERADVLMLKAKLLDRTGRTQEASDLLSRALPNNEDDPEFLELYGSFLLRSSNPAKGREYLEKVLETDPARISTLDLLLSDSIASGDWMKAESYVKRVLNLTETEKYYELGYEVALKLGKLDEALSYARKLYAVDETIYCLPLIRVLIEMKLTEEASQIISHSFSLSTGSEVKSMLYFYMSEIASDRTVKLDLLRNSLLEDLQNTNSLIAISHLFAEEGDYKTAVRYLRQAATLLPENVDIKRDIATYEAMMK